MVNFRGLVPHSDSIAKLGLLQFLLEPRGACGRCVQHGQAKPHHLASLPCDHSWHPEPKLASGDAPSGSVSCHLPKGIFKKCPFPCLNDSQHDQYYHFTVACATVTLFVLSPEAQLKRQAVLIADQIFSRCGAVPGILDAIIVLGDASDASESLAKAKALGEANNGWHQTAH